MIIFINGSFGVGKTTVAHKPEVFAWICQRVERCVDAFQSPTFATQIVTDDKTPDEIASEIQKYVKLS
jgi:hypothetical protein